MCILSSYLSAHNQSLQHIAIDVFEVDTLNPAFYRIAGDEIDLTSRRNIYIECFVNRFRHHMNRQKGELALNILCSGLSMNDETCNVSAVYRCLQSFPGVIANIHFANLTKHEVTQVRIANKKGRQANAASAGPPRKRNKNNSTKR